MLRVLIRIVLRALLVIVITHLSAAVNYHTRYVPPADLNADYFCLS